MNENNEYIKLDPKEFAKMVVTTHEVSDSLDPEAIVKRKLTLYLTAMIVAEKFNHLEQASFKNIDHETYEKLMSQLADETFMDW